MSKANTNLSRSASRRVTLDTSRIYTDLFYYLELENYFLTDNHPDDCFAREQRLRFLESILKTSFQKCFKQITTYHQKIIRVIREISVPKELMRYLWAINGNSCSEKPNSPIL